MRPFRSCLLLLLALFTACGGSIAQQVASPEFNRKLQRLLDEDTPMIGVADIDLERNTLLDARAREEFDVSHMPNARWVGYSEFDIARVSDLPKDRRIVVYCSVGYRSEKITERLLKVGFTDVHNLYGGIFEWVNSGHTVVDSAGTTKRIHAYDKDWSQWVTSGNKVY